MIPRYTHPDMGRLWSDQHKYETWLAVEMTAAEVMAAHGLVPGEAARQIRECAGFDVARIDEIENITKHDVIAFTTCVAERVGPAARWLHFGLTSSDVIDTAQALQMREACGLIVRDIGLLMEAVRERAEEHRHTPMIGRTHGVHAEPMTFGLKLALWYAELQRDLDRMLRARAIVALWHERDISHSSVERVILPDSFIALDHMLRRFTRIVGGMVVYPDRMLENLGRSRGVVFSGTVLLELARRGVSREQAYEWVQRNAMLSFAEQRDFKTLLESDTDISRVLSKSEIARAFDLNEQLKHVNDIFARVFQCEPVSS